MTQSHPPGGRTDLGPRLDLRRKTRRRTRLKRTAIGVLAVLLVGLLGWVVLFSSALETREVVVEGNQITTTEQVIEVAQVPLGIPLTRIPAAAIKQRILALPGVAEVKLHRNWPHRLGIEVIERTMVYQLVDAGGYQWVDAEGRVFYTRPDRVPGVVATTASDDQRILADVATVVAALPAEVAEQTEMVTAVTIDHIVISLADGRQIIWGNATKSAEKATVLGALLTQPGTIYDVSAPGYPAVR